MAVVMSQMPDVWQRALAEHVSDGIGRCRACCSPTGVQASWPCQTFKVADAARAMAEGRVPMPSPREPVSGSHRTYRPELDAAPSLSGPWSLPEWADAPSWAAPARSGSWGERRSDEASWSAPWSSEPWSSDPFSSGPVSTWDGEIADLPVPSDEGRWERERRDAWFFGSSAGDSWR